MVFRAAFGYPERVNPLIQADAGGWLLLAAHPHQNKEYAALAARLAERAPLLILDGGNHSNIHRIAEHANYREEVLERIRISRAFTCYQIAALLNDIQVQPASILILNLLNTFYDENVPFFDRERLLRACLQRIDLLGRRARLIVTTNPPPARASRSAGLYGLTLARAPRLITFEIPAPAERQGRLF